MKQKRNRRWLQWVGLFALMMMVLAACAGNPDNRIVQNANPDGMGRAKSFGNREDGGLIANPFTNDHVRGNRLGLHNNRRITKSEETARQLEAMGEVDKAVVFLSENNAYVAVKLNARANQATPGTQIPTGSDMEFGNRASDGQVNGLLKRRIASKVQSLHPEIRHVFVSANPDFTGAMQGFVDRLDRGNAMRELMEEFNQTVSRIFPSRPGEGIDPQTRHPDALGNVPQRRAVPRDPVTQKTR